MTTSQSGQKPLFTFDLDPEHRIPVFKSVGIEPVETGHPIVYIDGKAFTEWHGYTGRQKIDFINRATSFWVKLFKRARKQATIEEFEEDLNDDLPE